MKKTQAFFDQLADTWEDQSFPPETRKRVAELAGTFGIEKGATVLDVATGTGILHPYLLRAAGESTKPIQSANQRTTGVLIAVNVRAIRMMNTKIRN